jgi:hypothetical protein
MPTNSVIARNASLACLIALSLGAAARTAPPARVTLDLTTLHAAVLSTARNPGDSSDAPYLLVSVVGSAGRTQTQELPARGHWALRQDGAVGDTPITTLSLEPGDSVRVLLTVLEDHAASPQELQVATAATRMMAGAKSLLNAPPLTSVTPTLGPLTNGGAHWLGTASLLLTNDGGATYWTRLDCVATCKVSRGPATGDGHGAALAATTPQPVTGVVELSGASATYHLQVGLRRVP